MPHGSSFGIPGIGGKKAPPKRLPPVKAIPAAAANPQHFNTHVEAPTPQINTPAPTKVAGPYRSQSSVPSIRKAHRAEVRQQHLVDKYVNKAFETKLSKMGKLPTIAVGDQVEKAKHEVSDLRDKLLNHPAVKAANEEGKVVPPKRLQKLPGITGTVLHPGTEHKESGIEGVASGAVKGAAGVLKYATGHGPIPTGPVSPKNPIAKSIEGPLSTLAKKAKRHYEIGKPETPKEQIPTLKQAQAAGEIASLATGGSDLAKGIETGATILPKLASKEGLAAAGSKVGGAGKALAGLPRDVVDALKSTPEALRGSPAALRAAAKAAPRVAKEAAQAAPGAAARSALASGEKSLHSVGTLGALAATQKAGVHTPVGKAAEAFLSGTGSAIEHHPGETLQTTGRMLPALVTAPASLAIAGVQSGIEGSPKPFTKTATELGKGTLRMGEHLASGNPKEVEESIRKEVGLTPFVPLPAVLAKLHASDLYTVPRGALRGKVEEIRAGKRAKGGTVDVTGRHPTEGKMPKQPVPVELGSHHGPHENYVFRRLGTKIEGRKARQNVSLDTTRASEQGRVEEQMVGHSVTSAFRNKAGKLSPLHRKFPKAYEGTVGPMAKYGIPHGDLGAPLMRSLADYFGNAREAPIRGSWTDRMGANAGVEHPEILSEARHAAGVQDLRERQMELSRIRNRNDVAPHRVQNDFTNYLSRKEGLPPVLKDTERVSAKALEHTSPQEAAKALQNSAADLRARAEKTKSSDKAAALNAEATRLEQHAKDTIASGTVSREGAWHHYAELNREYEALRKSGHTEGAKAVLQQKKALYAELKQYSGFKLEHGKVVATNHGTSKLLLSNKGMKQAFREEQNARASHFGLQEPVYIKDVLPPIPHEGGKGLRVERAFPGTREHFKAGTMAQSGESDASLRGVLEHSAMQPRTRMAMNRHIYNTFNEAKVPVKVGSDFKSVMTVAEADRAKRDGTWPANTGAVDLGMVKQSALGPHGDLLAPEDVGNLVAAASGTADAGQAIDALPKDLRQQILESEGQKGRKIIAVNQATINEIRDQFTNSANPAWRNIRRGANVPTRLILNDPAWVFAQIFAKGIPIAAALGPDALIHGPAAIRAMAQIQQKSLHDQAIIRSIMGSSRGVLGTPGGAFEHHDPFANVDVLQHSGPGRVAWKLANGTYMGKWDRFNAAKMREFAAAVRASKGFRNWYGGFKGLNADMRRIAEATRGMSTVERLDYISKHPEMARTLQRHMNQIGGNWNSFTAMERKVAPFTIFYPWIRYSLDWTFHMFPVNHPVAATALALLAQQNSNELQKIASEAPGVKGITPTTQLQNPIEYSFPLTFNKQGEPKTFSVGTRIAPSLGVVGQSLVSGKPSNLMQALNPVLGTAISTATNQNFFTGQEQQGGRLANLADQLLSLSPAARLGEAAIGFRGFAKQGTPQSATSKAYDLLEGGRVGKSLKSFGTAYTPTSGEKWALKNALNTIEERIANTGSEAQAKIEWNVKQPSAKNKAEAAKVVAENKKAWEEKDRLLNIISPKLAKQAAGEYAHYKESLPPSFQKSGGIFSSSGSSSSIFGSGPNSGNSLFESGGEKSAWPAGKEYKPAPEGIHLPHVSIPGLKGITGYLGDFLGGTPAQAATLKRSRVGQVGQTARQKTHANHVIASQLSSWGLDPHKVGVLKKVEKETGVPAALLASISRTESTNGTSTLPGVHSGQNSAGAAGPFQMGNGTGASGNSWQTYSAQIWGKNAGKHSVYNYADAARAAGEYLKAAGVTKDPATWGAGALAYNHSSSYANEVVGNAQAAAGLPWGKASHIPTPYVNPFPANQWETERTDMGKDFGPKRQGAPILSIGKARVLKTGAPGWPGGGGVLYELMNGPQKGKVIYNYESVNPTVRPGQVVKKGQIIGRGWTGGTGVEAGYGTRTGEAVAAPEYHEGMETRAGKAFAGFLAHLAGGAPVGPGIVVSTSSGSTTVPGVQVAAYSNVTGKSQAQVRKELKAKKLSPLQMLKRIEQLTGSVLSPFSARPTAQIGPSASDLQEIAQAVSAARRKLAVS